MTAGPRSANEIGPPRPGVRAPGRTVSAGTLAGAKRISGATESNAGGPVYSLSEVHCT